jgi:uncharacterized membrane protein
VIGFATAAGKLPMLALILVDYLLIYYFVSRSLFLFSERDKKRRSKVITLADLLIDRRSELLAVSAVVYNVILGGFVVVLTTNPIVVLLFLSVNFVFIFYYVFEVFKEELKVQKFKWSNAELIKKANAEIGGRRKSQK